jgi:hypothetical protein
MDVDGDALLPIGAEVGASALAPGLLPASVGGRPVHKSLLLTVVESWLPAAISTVKFAVPRTMRITNTWRGDHPDRAGGRLSRGWTRGRGAGLGQAGMVMSEKAKNFQPDGTRVRA